MITDLLAATALSTDGEHHAGSLERLVTFDIIPNHLLELVPNSQHWNGIPKSAEARSTLPAGKETGMDGKIPCAGFTGTPRMAKKGAGILDSGMLQLFVFARLGAQGRIVPAKP